LLELAASKAESLTVEPIGREGLGIEFVAENLDGTREFHSVKRQRSRGEWSLAALTEKDGKTGRSILTDLLGKLSADGTDRCCFVSSTGANDLRELAERATRRQTVAEFRNDLMLAARLYQGFEKHLVPAASNDWNMAYLYLRQIRVVLIDEGTLTRQIEQQIAFLVYRPDLRGFSESEVRVLLGDFILDRPGTKIGHDAVWEFLSGFGYAKRDWATETTIRDLVRERNRTYARAVEVELINGARVPRKEAETVLDELIRCGGAKTVLVSAAAGVGKSCVMTQAVDGLEARDLPVLVVRMDRHGDARSTKDVGTQMGLPRSPAITLAGVANGRKSVLVIDQLDAVSQVSGRYPHLWEVFDSLCQEAAIYPNMRLLIACRDFDLQNDYRLRKLKQPGGVKQVPVQPLSPEDVDAALAAAGCAATRLTVRQKELLRTPFYLALFLSGLADDRNEIAFREIGDLFDRYWERKQITVAERLGGKNDWSDVVDRLCETMSRNLAVSVPAAMVDDWRDTVAAMLTEHVLVRDENQLRFFHESFFDYAFARRFIALGHDLKTLLCSGEQHLFRRSQVRQVLVFLRNQSRSQYLAQLRDLLSDSSIRFHIKRLILAWLGTLADPTSDEWALIEPLLSQSDVCRHALPAMHNNLAWFDLLNELGVVSRWLGGSDEGMVNGGVWLLSGDRVQKERSESVAALLIPYCGGSAAWRDRLHGYFCFGNAHCSRPMQELFLQALDTGILDKTSQNGSDSWCDHLREALEKAPLFALEALTRWLDRNVINRSSAGEENVLKRHHYDPAAVELISKIAQREPAGYVDMFYPRLLTILDLAAMPSDKGLRYDDIWYFRSNHEPMCVSDALLDGLVMAFEKLAKENAEKVEAVTSQLLNTDWYTVAYLLLRTWSANPARFGSTCIQFLTANRRRLEIGYGSWGDGGQGRAAISREAIQMCIPYAAMEEREQLERAILGFTTRGDEGEYEGWAERLLLEAFGEARLSEGGRDRLAALRIKFPRQDIRIPPRRCCSLGRVVVSPIAPEKARQLTDEEWLAAMRKYDYGWDGISRGLEFEMSGSAVELSRQLQPQAQREKQRFAALIDRMEDSIRPEYFAAVLDGICGQYNLPSEEREADDVDFRALGSDIVFGVIRRLHRLPNRPCGRSICRAFERLANRPIAEADMQILAYYAVDDPDSGAGRWLDGTREKNSDPSEYAHTYGYNSVRGHAARAIASLLFADYSRLSILVPLIRKMVHDPSIALRTCVVEALLPILNHDRNEAVRLFLITCRGAETVFGSGPFEQFVWYSSSTHYSEIRGVLFKALNSGSQSSVTAAARQVCLAAFQELVAEADAEVVLMGRTSFATAFRSIRSQVKRLRSIGLCRGLRGFLASLVLTVRSMRGFPASSCEKMRSAAAEVYSHNLGAAAVQAICQERLCHLFADRSEAVRCIAARCFINLENADFSKYGDLIRAYIESAAFPSPHDHLLRRLDDSNWQLPDVTIRLAKRFLAAYGESAADISTLVAGDVPIVSKLVVRLYVQTDDDSIRTKCLDLIDEMERLAFYAIDSQLAEHDR
jgi:hypothetical protein